MRDGPLAQLIVQRHVANQSLDANDSFLYDPESWWFPENNTQFPKTFDFLEPPNNVTINGHPDAFSLSCVITYTSLLQGHPE